MKRQGTLCLADCSVKLFADLLEGLRRTYGEEVANKILARVLDQIAAQWEPTAFIEPKAREDHRPF